MPKTINPSLIDLVQWPVQQCLAFSTTIHHPFNAMPQPTSGYGSFNLAQHVGDNPATVEDNRSTLQRLLPEPCAIQWLNQVHQADVVTIERVAEQPLTADAQITRRKHIALAIMTADCLPILLAAHDGSEIAAIHAGWRPLAQNIIANTLANMQTKAQDLVAWLGPCISQSAFEVGAELKTTFCTQRPALATAFLAGKPNHYFADLPGMAKILLAELGVSNIVHLNHCTFSNPHQYYSYRRSARTGRMATLICRN
jgi:polyphenol oxidase